MSRLEQFVRDHREEFDGEEPGQNLWDKIRTDMDLPSPVLATTESDEKRSARVIRITTRTWLRVAIAVIVVMAGGLLYTSTHMTGTTAPMAKTNLPQPASIDTGSTKPIIAETPVADSLKTSPAIASAKPSAAPQVRVRAPEDATLDEEMYHYARLVELKHKELKAIEKDEPLLYKQFAADVRKLDKVYDGLRSELPTNPNREQLLEAMVQNLQLQMGLLNHQLDIIKQINHSKQKAYEKAYKTI